MRTMVLVLAAASILSGCLVTEPRPESGATPPQAESPRDDERARPIVGPSVLGEEVRLALDRPTLLVFWASWCEPCRQKVPQLIETYQKLDEIDEVSWLGVCVDRDLQSARRFIVSHELPYRSLQDPDLVVADRFGVVGTPTYVVLDADGRPLLRTRELPLAAYRVVRAVEVEKVDDR